VTAALWLTPAKVCQFFIAIGPAEAAIEIPAIRDFKRPWSGCSKHPRALCVFELCRMAPRSGEWGMGCEDESD